MNVNDTIRGWKSKKFRSSLSTAQLETLSANPAGMQDLDIAKLEQVSGGNVPPNTEACATMVGCRRE